MRLLQREEEYPEPTDRLTEIYTPRNTKVLVQVMSYFQEHYQSNEYKSQIQFLQSYSLKKGIHDFFQRGKDTAFK